MILQKNSSARKYLASKSIKFFAKYYLRNYITTDIPKGGLHDQWASLLQKEINIAIAAPRSHGKSVWFSLIYPLWCILNNRKKFIIIISDSSTQSSSLLGAIVAELEMNEKILQDYGRIAGYVPSSIEDKQKWTANDIMTTTSIRVLALGMTSKYRGLRNREARPDLVILDDVENDENVSSQDQRDKIGNIFNKSILNLGDESTRYVYVGTILHYDSLLNNIINKGKVNWHTRLYRAIEAGNALWGEKWTLDRLQAKKDEIGTIAFEQEYMNNPLDESAQIIKPQKYYSSLDMGRVDFYGYIDLAISEKETADYTAVVTIARDRYDGKLYIIEPRRIRGDITRQLDLVFELNTRYPYRAFGVESVAYQKAFYQILNNESSKRGVYIPTVEVNIDKDKVRRTIEMTPYIENGTVLFNAEHQEFMAEIIQFPKGSHDDYVDALIGALKIAINGGGSGIIESRRGINYPE